MPKKTGSDFIVKLEGLNLSPAAARALAGNIQSVVLKELAAIDTGGDIRAHIPRKEWLGIWLARARTADLGNTVLQVQELKRK